ncbi:MAG: serine/threonine protein kinase [Cyanobacteria bacterium SBLK]|nr:serine/threonine protein kinase [Cyanobacteria bacterium SBLK]
MTYPDFTNYGYQIVRELGHNRAGGRVTYLATELNTNNSVVVKQFQFARSATQWSEYQAHEQEIKVLKNLNHPCIPRYLDSFPTASGFCTIQEYKNASSLVISPQPTQQEIQHVIRSENAKVYIKQPRQWTPQEVKSIAISVLEILKYLHTRIPPVIHRDLKPENILVDDRMNVYLVDFGFARIGGGEVAASSVVKGTLGFMPPEQMFNRQLLPASDLYSLGATLICLLTGTPSLEIGSLMDEMGRIQFRTHKAVTKVHSTFLDWLEKMVAPQAKNRYSSAEEALEHLIPLPLEIRDRFPMKKIALLAGIATGLAIAVFAGFESRYPGLIGNNAAIGEDIAILAGENVVLSRGNIDGESVTFQENGDRIIFEIDIPDLKSALARPASGSIKGTCQIFDGAGVLVGLGQSTLEAKSGKLKAWCPYEWSGDEQLGLWTFQFFADGRLTREKRFTVAKSQ